MISIILPASNEDALIGNCLTALLASADELKAQVIVVANGCSDDTADVARGFSDHAVARGWSLEVIERKQGGKLAALNSGDTASRYPIRVYLDADVIMSPQLLSGLYSVLNRDVAAYASGQVQIAHPQNRISRAYARIYAQVPFMTTGVPGCGLFAVNGQGRARWDAFPDIISDDTFVRLSFRPEERHLVPASYEWPIVEGLRNLLKVRRRQDTGVTEIRTKYPELLQNDDKPTFSKGHILRLALRDPIGFAVYSGVGLWARLGADKIDQAWSRGR
ncbi:MAG: glycosyl transferase [Gammaproteobacteria bacterium]|nr:MAG: glycosyl transferase [Gammaproteobacteria bacterium]